MNGKFSGGFWAFMAGLLTLAIIGTLIKGANTASDINAASGGVARVLNTAEGNGYSPS